MKLQIFHGRLREDTGGTDLSGNEVDDWGFEGPVLEGVTGVDFTYGSLYFLFEDDAALQRAKYQTGWRDGVHGNDLEMEFGDGGSLISLMNFERERREYFGDYMLVEDTPRT